MATRAKADHSFVSEADEATERLVRARLADAFPDEPILGEEFGFDADDIGDDAHWWAVDPLDGTSNFLGGLPIFAVAMCRFAGRRPVLAITHHPLTGDTFVAERGAGARRNGTPLRVADTSRGALDLVAIRHRIVRRNPELATCLGSDKLRTLGSACLEAAYVAAGIFRVGVAERVHLWDIAGGALMIEEAGGDVRMLDGSPFLPLAKRPVDYGDEQLTVIAGAPDAVESVRRAMSA